MASPTDSKGSVDFQDHPDWQYGDFTLISSDGWRFKAPSYSLFHASAVLRDAPNDGPKEITFTDEVIEAKSILEQFLYLAVYSRLIPRASTNWETACDQLSNGTMDVLLHLVSFLQKYDCMPTLRNFCGEIAMLVNFNAIDALDAFSLGAIAGDDDLCAASLTTFDTPGDSDSGDAKEAPETDVPINIQDIQHFVWERAAPRYMYALTKRKWAVEVEDDDDPIAKTFLYYLNEAKSSGKTFSS